MEVSNQCEMMVRIKGKKDGLIAEVDSDKFGNFEDILETLTLKAFKREKIL